MATKEIILPDGWKVSNVKGNKIYIEKDKPLPSSWKEYCKETLSEGKWYISADSEPIHLETIGRLLNEGHGRCFCNTEQQAESFLALHQLILLRDEYRQGWKPDWNSKDQYKYCVKVIGNDLVIEQLSTYSNPLSFQTEELARKFMENFRDLIMETHHLHD